MRAVCGLYVHKDSVFLCILRENGEKIEKVFGVLTPELDAMRDMMVSHDVGEVAMGSTSVYWIPVWRVLEADFDLKLVNPLFYPPASRKEKRREGCPVDCRVRDEGSHLQELRAAGDNPAASPIRQAHI